MDYGKESLMNNLIHWIAFAVLSMTLFVAMVAFFSTDIEGEASIGSFEAQDFDYGWRIVGTDQQIELPYFYDEKANNEITIENILPANLSDDTSLMIRATVEDVFIYINGELREEYSTALTPYMAYYNQSAYVVTKLSSQDASKAVLIKIVAKGRGVINRVQLGAGNNVWFNIIFTNLPVNIVAFIVLILGVIVLAFSLFLRGNLINNDVALYLSLLMIDIALWVFSESSLRQLIFAKPSLTQYFSYSAVELIGVFTCMFFDEVQRRRYHKFYFVAELLGTITVVTNFILHFSGVIELYKSMVVAHVIMILSLIMSVSLLVNDIRTARVAKYKAIALGMAFLLLASAIEIISFYVSRVHVFGTFICIGLVVLMVATVIQTLLDQAEANRKREAKQRESIVNTIRTIAGTIDAKDEYTGGHSDRVGLYASILARGMAADYNFTEEDIERIRYIGSMHDIGKIGIPDRVLNKAGRLTDEEYAIMKTHVEIGSDILDGMDDSIKDLRDGVRYHHERFDGKGYPEGLSETNIPLVARIICLADCYDAMTSDRVYRKRLSDEAVREEILRCAGTQFDPALAEIFVRLMDDGELRVE